MASIQPILSNTSLYDQDFHAWTQDQAARLRRAAAERDNTYLGWTDLDWDHLAEELDTMGRSERGAIESRLHQLLFHLAKLACGPSEEPRRGWRVTVLEQRRRLTRLLRESPSLRPYPSEILAETWDTARQQAEAETNVLENTLPQVCPWDLDREILAEGWLPQPPAAPDSSV